MARVIELPKLSPTMEEGTLVRWSKREGDAIGVDDLLAEVETDKATMEFRSFDRGTLLARLVAEGAVAKLGQPVAIFGEPGEDVSALVAQLTGKAPERTSAPAVLPAPIAAPSAASPPSAGAPTKAPQPVAQGPAASTAKSESGVAGVILAPSTPRVRRIARERDLSLAGVKGSGAHGRVTEDDLPTIAPRATPAAAPAQTDALMLAVKPGDTLKTPSATRRTIARRLVEAKQTVPHFYLEADLDVEALAALRERLNEGASADDKVSFNDLIVRASALALRAVPESNASWIDGQIVVYDRVDVSIAVAIEDGLVTPVIRGADRLSVRALARVARDLAARGRARKLKPEEMQSGTFSVSNLGMFQVDRFAAVINPPESMILAVGATRDVPVVKGGAVVPGKRCAVTLSCDHRVVDGALGARFLLALRKLVERPLDILA
ncbi:MAG: dihydrolipoamide acetyltransferase family protein [Polyangiales bacterium]